MTLCIQDYAAFETTKRLLAQIVNEGLVAASFLRIEFNNTTWLCLQSPESTNPKSNISQVRVSICADRLPIITERGQVVSLVRPDSLRPPVILDYHTSFESSNEYDPGTIFEHLYAWFGKMAVIDLREKIVAELRNSAANQGTWTLVNPFSINR
jgi:hypothetical protein